MDRPQHVAIHLLRPHVHELTVKQARTAIMIVCVRGNAGVLRGVKEGGKVIGCPNVYLALVNFSSIGKSKLLN